MTILNSELVPVLGTCCPDYASRFGEHSNDIMRLYAEQLLKNEIGRKGLNRGIERLKAGKAPSRFTPTPAEFVTLCKPSAEELGIPDLDHCIHEITEARGRWRFDKYLFAHDLVRHMNERVGPQMCHSSINQFRKLCEREYNRLIELARDGKLPSFSERPPRQADERSYIEKSGKQLNIDEAKAFLQRFGIDPFKRHNQPVHSSSERTTGGA